MHATRLTDGVVALLARQAVDLLDPELDVRIEPGPMTDPYRLQRAGWTVRPHLEPHAGRGNPGIPLAVTLTPVQALAALINGLSDAVVASPRFWARVFPTCGEHPHAAVAVDDGDAVSLRCPDTGEERVRIAPEDPGD